VRRHAGGAEQEDDGGEEKRVTHSGAERGPLASGPYFMTTSLRTQPSPEGASTFR
jgi:hypothetical protein